MATVTVIATRDFTFDGREVHRGEAVTMPAIHAAVRARCGDVSLDAGRRSTYTTKDMLAQPVTAPVTVAPPPEPPAPTPRRRRRTRQPKASA